MFKNICKVHQIKDIYSKEMATAVVVGLPLGSEGEDTKMSKVCRKLGEEIAKLGCPVHYVDEAFTSVNATAHLRDHDWTAATRRKHIDSEAACQILELEGLFEVFASLLRRVRGSRQR